MFDYLLFSILFAYWIASRSIFFVGLCFEWCFSTTWAISWAIMYLACSLGFFSMFSDNMITCLFREVKYSDIPIGNLQLEMNQMFLFTYFTCFGGK